MCEAALEALVRHLKTFTLLQGTRHATFDVRLQTKPSERREKPAFRRRKEEKGQTQPQLYGTQYFSVRIALTGLMECRQIKEKLTQAVSAKLRLLLQPGAVLFQHEITRETFENLIRDRVESTVQKTRTYLQRAEAAGYQVDTILLTGGSIQIPLVQKMLQAHLPLQPTVWQSNVQASALGATYYIYALQH
jgi:molecular chaperone DnaK (HSP70)